MTQAPFTGAKIGDLQGELSQKIGTKAGLLEVTELFWSHIKNNCPEDAMGKNILLLADVTFPGMPEGTANYTVATDNFILTSMERLCKFLIGRGDVIGVELLISVLSDACTEERLRRTDPATLSHEIGKA